MLDSKTLADLVTILRGLLGILLAWLGLTQGAAALPAVTMIMILCFTGDFVDGTLAHLSQHPRQTWVGNHDIQFDIFVSLCLGAFLIGAGFVSLQFAAWYLVAWVFVLWLFKMEYNLLMLIQAPIYFCFLWLAITLAPQSGFWLVLWIMLATAINWRRFSKQIVPRFVHGMQSIWNGFRKPRHL